MRSRQRGGKLSRSYFVAGLARPWDNEAKRQLAAQITTLVRRSGFGAEARTKAILQKKGVSGVMVALLWFYLTSLASLPF